jgi:hypothetical protein
MSSVSITFKSDNIMSWSPTLEQDCEKLALNEGAENDDILVAMVRISRICLQATEAFRLLNDSPESGAHTALHISPLKKSLDECRALLSDRQKQHCECCIVISTHSKRKERSSSQWLLLTRLATLQQRLGYYRDHRLDSIAIVCHIDQTLILQHRHRHRISLRR